MIISKMGHDYQTIMPNERSGKIMGELMKMMARENNSKVLDVGCGEGSVGFILSGMGMKVTGVDKNHEKILKARAKGVEALEIDAHSLFFDKEFDVAFSVNALHRMRRPQMVIESVYRALKKEGRFIGEIASENNDAALNLSIQKILENNNKNGLYLFDYYQPNIEDYKSKLESKGFLVKSIEMINYAIDLPDNFDEWLNLKLLPFKESFFEGDFEKNKFYLEVKEEMLPLLKKDNGRLTIGQSSILFCGLKKE